MLRNMPKTCSLLSFRLLSSTGSCQITKIRIDTKLSNNYEIVDTRVIPSGDTVNCESGESLLKSCQEDVSHVAPYLKPSFNFAAYINKSNTLQQLLKLGVKLYKLEKDPEIPNYILKLDFDRDIKNYIIFLSDLGLQTEDLVQLIEKNPLIFKEDLKNLEIRINYLKFKKFTNQMVLRIVQSDPMWLSFSTQEIDKRLGFFQKNFLLKGNEVRSLAVKRPRLITHKIEHTKLNTFVLKEEMGFNPEEVKQILLQTPKLFMNNQHRILKTFEYIHKEMHISLETIAKVPQILTCREFRIKQRHQFLTKLGRTQFNPKKTNYISLVSLVSGSDAYFATEVAGSSIHAFNAFLKSM